MGFLQRPLISADVRALGRVHDLRMAMPMRHDGQVYMVAQERSRLTRCRA